MTKTPGYVERLSIWFATDKNGKRIAYRWSASQFRGFRMGLAEAELLVAQNLADEITGNPIKEAKAYFASRYAAL